MEKTFVQPANVNPFITVIGDERLKLNTHTIEKMDQLINEIEKVFAEKLYEEFDVIACVWRGIDFALTRGVGSIKEQILDQMEYI